MYWVEATALFWVIVDLNTDGTAAWKSVRTNGMTSKGNWNFRLNPESKSEFIGNALEMDEKEWRAFIKSKGLP